MLINFAFFTIFQIHQILCQSSANAEREKEECVRDWLQKQPDLLNRFRRDQLLFMCQRNRDWKEAANSPTSPVSDFLTPKQLAYLGQLRDCQGADCLKNIGPSPIMPVQSLRLNTSDLLIDFRTSGRGGEIGVVEVNRQNQAPSGDGRALRKEYRAMTDQERNRYHEAIRKLKSEKIDGMSKYDLLVVYHTPQEAPEAHWGPAFLPYHREYLKQYELALRQVDANAALPYWDSTLDEGLPSPRDSVLWTSEFLGSGEGPIANGPFAGWLAVQELPNAPGDRRLVRQVGTSPFGGLYKPSDIDFILSRSRYDDLTTCVDPTFELTHGIVHSFVGGYMLEINISPNDPAFYMHHGFIDYLWEQFRQTRQNSRQRQQDYPTPDRSCNDFHQANAQMKPFPIKNIDGLSERYTSELYRYEQKPVCNQNGRTCAPESPYLFCHTRTNRCLSKVQLNGNCSGFENQDICYKGSCRRGKCVMADIPDIVVTEGTTRTNPPRPTQPPVITQTYAPPTQFFTFPPATAQTNSFTYPTQTYATPLTEVTYKPIGPTNRPPYTGGNYYYWTTQKPNIVSTAYITVTVVKGYGGYYAQHAAGATVKAQGLNNDYSSQGTMWPTTTSPSYVGACVLKIYAPDRNKNQVRFSIDAADANGKQCKIQCWDDSQKRYGNCSRGNVFEISVNGQGASDPIPYFNTEREALEKRWVGSGYRRYRLPDFIVFQCN